jgi:hypothetical protein
MKMYYIYISIILQTCYELGNIVSCAIRTYAGTFCTCFFGPADRTRHEGKGILPVAYCGMHGLLRFNIFRDRADTIQTPGI